MARDLPQNPGYLDVQPTRAVGRVVTQASNVTLGRGDHNLNLFIDNRAPLISKHKISSLWFRCNFIFTDVFIFSI